mmetsp:Transcript_13187/g.46128  ORF Transcript_13187/g.46128 Transcript_13187/m.46128 type:complete len:264 (+) Transcript_13187:261-1052(+)
MRARQRERFLEPLQAHVAPRRVLQLYRQVVVRNGQRDHVVAALPRLLGRHELLLTVEHGRLRVLERLLVHAQLRQHRAQVQVRHAHIVDLHAAGADVRGALQEPQRALEVALPPVAARGVVQRQHAHVVALNAHLGVAPRVRAPQHRHAPLKVLAPEALHRHGVARAHDVARRLLDHVAVGAVHGLLERERLLRQAQRLQRPARRLQLRRRAVQQPDDVIPRLAVAVHASTRLAQRLLGCARRSSHGVRGVAAACTAVAAPTT